MNAVPRLRPYATHDEWRRDFHDGMALLDEEPPTPDVWDVLDRADGYYIASTRAMRAEIERYVDMWEKPDYEDVGGAAAVPARPVAAYNRRSGEVVYGEGV